MTDHSNAPRIVLHAPDGILQRIAEQNGWCYAGAMIDALRMAYTAGVAQADFAQHVQEAGVAVMLLATGRWAPVFVRDGLVERLGVAPEPSEALPDYATAQEARAAIQETRASLEAEFQAYAAEHSLPDDCDAMELLVAFDLADDVRLWLSTFKRRWEAMEKAEKSSV